MKVDKKKLAISFLTSSVGIIILLIIMFFAMISAVFGQNSGSYSVGEDGNKIKDVYIEKYEQLNEDNNLSIPLKYLYSIDAVKRKGEFDDENIKITKEDLICIYDKDDTNKILYEEDNEELNNKFYDCMGYNNSQIDLFKYSLYIYSEFGKNDDISAFGNFLRPIANGVVTNEFGGTDLSFSGGGHTGIDVANKIGEPIYATAEGEVIRSGFQEEAGNNVIIKHNIGGEKFVTYYGHMNKTPLVKVGDKVTSSTKIGEIGATGNVTGPHLHFEIQENTQTNNHNKAVDPRKYIDFPPIGEPFNDRGSSGGILDEEKIKIMKSAGIKKEDYGHVDYIVSHESTWNYKATNQSSGAYGLCQALPPEKLAEAGEDWKTNPITQMKWCDSYAHERYGSWAKAEEWWRKNHWW